MRGHAIDLSIYGCDMVFYQVLRGMGRTYHDTPLRPYAVQRASAIERGIEWDISVVDWWRIWQESGKWAQRGQKGDEFVMGRFLDQGPYAVGNVYICTRRVNFAHRYWGISKSGERVRLQLPTGWPESATKASALSRTLKAQRREALRRR